MQSVELLKKSNGTFENLTRSEVRTVISELTPQLAAMIGDVKLEARFTESLINICLDGKLIKCDAISVISAAYTSATLNLSINPTMGEGYVVPFNVNIAPKGMAKVFKSFAQFQIGYQGYKKMGFKAGVQAIHGKAVFKGDEFYFEFGTNATLKYIPKFVSDEIEFVYFEWWLNGIHQFEVFNKAWVEDKRRRNKSQVDYNTGQLGAPKDAWATDYGTMAIGKLIKYCRRFIPLSPEFEAMAERDETVFTGKLSDDGKLEITPHVELENDTPIPVPVLAKQKLTAPIVEQIILLALKDGKDGEKLLDFYSKTIEINDQNKVSFRIAFKKKLFDPSIEPELYTALIDGDENTESLIDRFYFTIEQKSQYKKVKNE